MPPKRRIYKRGRRLKTNRQVRSPGNGMSGGGGVSTTIVERWMPLFPPKTKKTLRYAEFVQLASGALGAVGTYVFRANDLYDPNVTGTGHQPMGFDEMMLYYNHFCVTRSKITITFRGDGASVAGVCCIRVDANLTPLTSTSQIVETGYAAMASFEPKNVYGANKKIFAEVDICKVQGVPYKAILADVNLRGTAASSPSEVTYYHAVIWNPAGVTVGAFLDVIIEYEAVFTEPRNITQSLASRFEEMKLAIVVPDPAQRVELSDPIGVSHPDDTDWEPVMVPESRKRLEIDGFVQSGPGYYRMFDGNQVRSYPISRKPPKAACSTVYDDPVYMKALGISLPESKH